MKLFKRLGAVLLALVLVIGCFAGCHGKEAVVATATAADGSAINVPAGVYLAMLLNADSEARNLVVEALGENASDDINFAKQTVTAEDGTEYKFNDYVKMRADEICRSYISTHYLFAKNNCVLTDTEESTMSSYIQYQWAYTGGAYLYEPNGVSYDSFLQYMRVISYERSNLFDFYYDNGGEKEPSKDVITKGLTDNFLIANVIEITTKDSDNKTLSEDKLNELEAKLQAYADRINAGEDFKVINDEYEAEKKAAEDEAETDGTSSDITSSDTSSSATSSDATSSITDPTAPQPKDSLAKLYGSTNTSASSGNFTEFAKLETGKASVVKGTDGFYRMVLRKDILDDEYYYTELKNEVTRILYAEEFEDFLDAEGKNIAITYNDYERDYLKPSKIDYEQYQAWYASMTQSYNG